MLEKLEPLARDRRCRSFLDYYYLLKFDGETVGEWPRVMDALSVQETYFWREMDQINALTKIIVPGMVRKDSGSTADMERGVRDRRGTIHDRHRPGGGRMF